MTDEKRCTYAASLVKACRTKGIQAIAVTDHHDMAFIHHIRNAAEDERDESGNELDAERRLIVFPGMELTLGVPCQALLVFDAEFPDDMFKLAMTALAITPMTNEAPKIAEVKRLDKIDSLRELKEKLDEHEFLRNQYIVLPHVGKSGDSSLLRKGLSGKYVEMPWVGGYVDGLLPKLPEGKRNILEGKDPNWGNKRIACFQTSDNRQADHGQLGSSTTWIKWATPTAEALRQACLAQESRISQEQPILPSVAISKVSVTNCSFLGPFDLELNSQYNAFIGGRGTGKSTILEYMRWALCDQPPPETDGVDIPNYLTRRRRLVDETLKPVSGTVEVSFDKNGVRHVVRRESQSGNLMVKIGTADMQPCVEEDIRTLLPIQAYSQKQLSDVSVRVEELFRFIRSPIRAELESVSRDLRTKGEEIRQAYSAVRRERTLKQTIKERRLVETSLHDQADHIRDGLTGLSTDDQRTLDSGQAYRAAHVAVAGWRRAISELVEKLDELRRMAESNVLDAGDPPDEPEGEILRNMHEQFLELHSSTQEAVEAMLGRTRRVGATPPPTNGTDPWQVWMDRYSQFMSTYSAALERSSTHGEQIEELRRIEGQLERHAQETNEIAVDVTRLGDAESAYRKLRVSWEEHLKKRDNLIETQCERLTEDSEGVIRATLSRLVNASAFVEALRQALSGARVHTGRFDGLADWVSSGSTVELRRARWKAVLRDLERLAEFDPERDGIQSRPESPELTRAGFSSANLDGISRVLSTDDWITLSLTEIPSEPVFEFRSRELEYIPFRNASAGQQATALLKTLLNQSGPPLIIDQPEEDLDNPVVLEIVEQVWRAKQRRQLIIASHNANLVVNGDAELVVWCDHRTSGDHSRGVVGGEGAIDVNDVRAAVRRIMEGGEAAFRLRKEKYGF